MASDQLLEHCRKYRGVPRKHSILCEHCGIPFLASNMRIKRGPRLCFFCRLWIIEGGKSPHKINPPVKGLGRSFTRKYLEACRQELEQ